MAKIMVEIGIDSDRKFCADCHLITAYKHEGKKSIYRCDIFDKELQHADVCEVACLPECIAAEVKE